MTPWERCVPQRRGLWRSLRGSLFQLCIDLSSLFKCMRVQTRDERGPSTRSPTQRESLSLNDRNYLFASLFNLFKEGAVFFCFFFCLWMMSCMECKIKSTGLSRCKCGAPLGLLKGLLHPEAWDLECSAQDLFLAVHARLDRDLTSLVCGHD